MHYETHEHARDGSPMVLVPAGPFVMGLADKDLFAEEHEKPEREVHLDAFWIDLYPVTNARFARFLKEGGYLQPRFWNSRGWVWKCQHGIRQPLTWGQAGWDGPDQPVAGVCWYEADAYARWAGRRLPTDAEWEKAARGTDGRRYPWGDDWPTAEVANFNHFVGRTTPVGLYPKGASPYGCHDMAGNVNNWVSDWYLEGFGALCVQFRTLYNPHVSDRVKETVAHLGPMDQKVDRGGGFATARECQEVLGCTRKVFWPPEQREAWNGFRTAMDATAW